MYSCILYYYITYKSSQSVLFVVLVCSGLYGVGKAAVNPPALVVLSHTPMSATRTIAWCGKGIVYDTGGLCIKAKVLFNFAIKLQYYREKNMTGTKLFIYVYFFHRHIFACSV